MHILFLLVGSNPLPDYTVGDYLLKSERQDKNELPLPDLIVLVHSEETKRFAQILKGKFKHKRREIKVELIDLKDKENDPKNIKNILNNFLEKKNNISSLHLNFTGGKKTMSVYTYMIIYNYAKKNEKKAIFSYLDPDKHWLVLEDSRHFPTDNDLRRKVFLNINTLLELHDMEIKNQGKEKPLYKEIMNEEKFNEVVKYILQTITEDRKKWKSEMDKFRERFSDKIKTKTGKLKKKTKLIEEIKKANEDGIFESLFNHSFGLLKNNKYDVEQAEKFPSFYKFVTGGWLEDLVLITLQKLQKEEKIKVNDIRKNIKAKYKGRETEIDIIVIKGYEMFLISCTTDNGIGLVKQKAFEAIYRAQQLGGEHAKVIVVSLMDNTRENDRDNNLEELKKDLSQFDAARNAGQNLIGIDEIRKELGLSRQGVSLSEKLISIIEQ